MADEPEVILTCVEATSTMLPGPAAKLESVGGMQETERHATIPTSFSAMDLEKAYEALRANVSREVKTSSRPRINSPTSFDIVSYFDTVTVGMAIGTAWVLLQESRKWLELFMRNGSRTRITARLKEGDVEYQIVATSPEELDQLYFDLETRLRRRNSGPRRPRDQLRGS